MNAFYAKFNIYALPGGNTGAQMGGWFRKEINTVADLNGLKMRIARLCRRRHGEARRGAAAGRRRRASIRSSRRARSTPPNGSAPMTTRSSASTRSPSTTTTRAGGRAAPWSTSSSTRDKWNALPKTYQAMITAAAAYANVWMQSRYDAVNPKALRSLVANGTRASPVLAGGARGCFKAANEVYAEIGAKNADSRRSTTT